MYLINVLNFEITLCEFTYILNKLYHKFYYNAVLFNVWHLMVVYSLK